MKNSFLKVLFSVCTGVDIFREIVKFPLFRAFRHLLLLSVLCSFVYVLVQSPGIKRDIDSMTGYFEQQFGKVLVKDTGVYPEKNPEEPRSLSYNFVQINYFPQEPVGKDLDIDYKLNNSGFVWEPKGIVGWLKLDDSKFFVYQALSSLSVHNWFGIIAKEEIYSYLKSSKIDDFKQLRFSFFVPMNEPLFGVLSLRNENSLPDYSGAIYYWSAFGMLIRLIAMIIFNSVFYSLIFALIHTISNRTSPIRLKFKAFLAVAVYAGFPGIIIGTIFTVAEIPWLRYQTIFLIAFIAYLIVVTQKLRRLGNDNGMNLTQK